MLMSIFLGILVLNENLNEYSIEDLINKMAKVEYMGKKQFI